MEAAWFNELIGLAMAAFHVEGLISTFYNVVNNDCVTFPFIFRHFNFGINIFFLVYQYNFLTRLNL